MQFDNGAGTHFGLQITAAGPLLRGFNFKYFHGRIPRAARSRPSSLLVVSRHEMTMIDKRAVESRAVAPSPRREQCDLVIHSAKLSLRAQSRVGERTSIIMEMNRRERRQEGSPSPPVLSTRREF